MAKFFGLNLSRSNKYLTNFIESYAQDASQTKKNQLTIRLILFSITFFILTSLFLVILGKSWFNFQAINPFLNIYGVVVTGVLFMNFIITFIYYKDPYIEVKNFKLKSGTKPLFASIMVAVFNEEEIIKRCLDSLVNQSYQYKEVIVVNDCSTDGTAKILDEYSLYHDIKVIHLPNNMGKKKALAQAMLNANGEIFAFTDSDSILAEDAIEKIVKIFEHTPSVGGVSGHSRVLNADTNLLTKMQDAWYEGQFSIRKAYESIFGAVTCVSGPLAVFRKATIYNYIPAWENDQFLGQEFKFATDRTLTGFTLGCTTIGAKLKKKYADSPFVTQVNYPEREWRVVYSKSARALTHVPDTFKRIIKQQIRWKKSFIRNTFFTGHFFWKKAFPVAFVYYLHILFVFAGPFIFFRHLIYLPFHGDMLSAIVYLMGIAYIGFLFGLAYKIEDRSSSFWIYRPLMSLLSTLVLSWLIFYSMVTIKKMTWSRA